MSKDDDDMPKTPQTSQSQRSQLSPDTNTKLRNTMETNQEQVSRELDNIAELDRIMQESPLVNKLVAPFLHGMYREHDEDESVFAERVAQEMITHFNQKTAGNV